MPPQLPPQLTDAIGKRVLLLTPRYSSIGILGTLKLSNPQDNLSRFEFLMLPQWVYDSVLKLEKPRGFLANAENLPIGLIRLRE